MISHIYNYLAFLYCLCLWYSTALDNTRHDNVLYKLGIGLDNCILITEVHTVIHVVLRKTIYRTGQQK